MWVVANYVISEGADGGAGADFRRRVAGCFEQGAGGPARAATLPPGAGHIGVQPGAPLGCGELVGAQCPAGGDGSGRVA